MFAVGQIVAVKSSHLRRRIVEVLPNGEFVTTCGGHVRTMKAANLITVEAADAIDARAHAKLQKKFGKR